MRVEQLILCRAVGPGSGDILCVDVEYSGSARWRTEREGCRQRTADARGSVEGCAEGGEMFRDEKDCVFVHWRMRVYLRG